MELRRPGSPGRQYYCKLLLYAYMSYAKNAKETETEETIRFFVTFLSLVAFQLGGGGPPAPLATPLKRSTVASS